MTNINIRRRDRVWVASCMTLNTPVIVTASTFAAALEQLKIDAHFIEYRTYLHLIKGGKQDD